MDRKIVPPQKPSEKSCGIMFVGEAPSWEELALKKPFVGPAGGTFNAILRTANIDRDRCWVTNVFNEKAEDNDCTEFMKDDGIRTEAFKRLAAEIDEFAPTVIVPMGGTALWAFIGDTKISAFRGAVTKAKRIKEGVKLVPTYHPSAVQKDWRLLTLVTGDCIKAVKESKFPEIRYPKRTLLIEPTLEDFEWFIRECIEKDCSLLAPDIETGWGQITAVGFAPSSSLAMCVPFVDLRKPNNSYWGSVDEEVEAWRLVKRALENDVPKVGQNLTYDIDWLLKLHGIGIRNYRWDTRLLHKVMYPELPADLGSMAAGYTGLGSWKNWAGGYRKEEKEDA